MEKSGVDNSADIINIVWNQKNNRHENAARCADYYGRRVCI